LERLQTSHLARPCFFPFLTPRLSSPKPAERTLFVNIPLFGPSNLLLSCLEQAVLFFLLPFSEHIFLSLPPRCPPSEVSVDAVLTRPVLGRLGDFFYASFPKQLVSFLLFPLHSAPSPDRSSVVRERRLVLWRSCCRLFFFSAHDFFSLPPRASFFFIFCTIRPLHFFSVSQQLFFCCFARRRVLSPSPRTFSFRALRRRVTFRAKPMLRGFS